MSRSLKVTAVVSIAMIALLFAMLQRGRTLRSSQILQQLPGTARAVLRVEPGALEGAAAARALFDAFVAEEQLSEIETSCGLDPLASLSDATVWVRGPDDQPFQSIGLMLRGRSVDAAALLQCYALLVEARGGSIVRLQSPAGALLASRDRRSAIARLDERTIVTGSVDTVVEAMAVQRGTAPALTERARIATRWPRLSAGACIAAVLDPPTHWKSALERIAELGDGTSALKGVESIALAVQSGSANDVEVYIDVTAAEQAAQDAALIRTWLASASESIGAPWAEVLHSARVQVRGRTISVTLDVSSLSRTP